MAIIRGVVSKVYTRESKSDILKNSRKFQRISQTFQFHSPDGCGCQFAHSAAFDVVLKFNGYHSS